MSNYKITSLDDDDAAGATIALPLGASPPPVPITAAPVTAPPTPTTLAAPSAASTSSPSSTTSAATSSTFFGRAAQALVGGRYEIIRLVGAGGMGSVYQARDTELDEIVALKTLRRELIESQEMLDRFKNEVKLARRVTHRNVARMFDIGEHEGEKFLTMEFVDGESLAALVEREKRLPIPRVVEIIAAVCAGLSAAHAAGVIHRDLKPDNVMIAKDGRVLVTDFGIARASFDTGGRTVGLVLGTPAYMAPEQVQGIKDIDARADIYALGAMLYELFTGQDAWAGETPMGIATARLLRPPPDPRIQRRDLPEGAARVVLRCMATQRDDRYTSTDDIARELADLTLAPRAPSSAASQTMTTPTSVFSRKAPSLPEPASADKSVAVLPFRNAGAPSDEYLADGLTDDLIDALSMTRGLRVCSRGSVAKFRGTSADAREIGSELGVQVVVEGSVRKSPGAVRISARLISVADGFQLWAKRFDRPDTDLFTINDEAAHAIAEALTVRPTAPAREAPSDPVAIELYLRARNEYHKMAPDNVARSVELFEQALARAPNDPTILAGYAMARARYNFFVGDDNDVAKQAAEHAVAAAPNLPEAHLALATVRLQMGDPAGAVREAKLAIAAGPALAEAHWLLGRILCEADYLDEGMRRLDLANTLDPSTTSARRDLARAYALLGSWAKCDAILDPLVTDGKDLGVWFDRARMSTWRPDPDLARRYLAEVSLPAGRMQFVRFAFTLIAEPPTTSPFEDEILKAFIAAPKGAPRRLSYFSQIEAEIASHFGERERAATALTRAVEAGLFDLCWFVRCQALEPLRCHISYKVQLARVEERARMIVEAYTSS